MLYAACGRGLTAPGRQLREVPERLRWDGSADADGVRLAPATMPPSGTYAVDPEPYDAVAGGEHLDGCFGPHELQLQLQLHRHPDAARVEAAV